MLRGSIPWLRRGASAALLLAVGFTPAEASVTPPRPCPGACTQAGTTRWVRPLTGTYVVQADSRGTMPTEGEPYAAIGPDVAALGDGTTVQAFDSRTGAPRWTAQLGSPPAASATAAPGSRAGGAGPGQAAGARQATGTPQAVAGQQIVSVRSWPGVVTVGLGPVPGAAGSSVAGTTGAAGHMGAGRHPAGGQQSGQQALARQTEVVLDAATGRQLRTYSGAPFGGTVAADSRHTVVVGAGAVTSYRNSTGAAGWSVPTGPGPQTWRLDGNFLYLALGAGGGLGGLAQPPASQIRRIDLRTGSERVVRAHPGPFAGSLGAALDGVLLFSDAGGVTAYDGANGRKLWSRDRQDIPQGVDLLAHRFYLSEQGGLAAVDPWTGSAGALLPGSSGLYAERGGVALGMDGGAGGSAWGVNTQTQRVVWTDSSLPWPHYFVDLSGVGGSADPRSDAVLVASCGQATTGSTAQSCAKPELVAINRLHGGHAAVDGIRAATNWAVPAMRCRISV